MTAGLLAASLFLSSCASLARYPGVGRIRRYCIESAQVPPAFDGFKVAFASDFHYPSKFTAKRLRNAVRALQSLTPDVLLLGGDYQNGCENDAPLFDSLGQVVTPYGKYAVMGNHDEPCRSEIEEAMQRNHIVLLEHAIDTLHREGESLYVCGVRNPFDLKKNGLSPSLVLPDSAFVLMLVHAPDYADEVDISHTDLVLAGHTHGGQVRFLGLYTPVKHTLYGLLSGLKTTTQGIPIIITNGLGTSRHKIRFCAPSEVVLVTLKRAK